MRFKAHLTGEDLKVYAQADMKKWLRGQNDGEMVVDIRSKRSNEKRTETIAYFWVLMKCAVDYTGHTELELYDICCHKLFLFKNDEDGEPVEHSLSQLDDNEMITGIRRWEEYMLHTIEMPLPEKKQGVIG